MSPLVVESSWALQGGLSQISDFGCFRGTCFFRYIAMVGTPYYCRHHHRLHRFQQQMHHRWCHHCHHHYSLGLCCWCCRCLHEWYLPHSPQLCLGCQLCYCAVLSVALLSPLQLLSLWSSSYPWPGFVFGVNTSVAWLVNWSVYWV